MERQGLLEIGQEVEISEECTSYFLLLYDYTCHSDEQKLSATHERLKATRGIVREINETERGFYTLVEFRRKNREEIF